MAPGIFNPYAIAYAVFALILSMVFVGACAAQLVDPIYSINSSTPAAEGVASYGLYNISNDSGAYQVETNEVIGYARINALSAFNSTPPVNISRYGATLQLNVVMNITTPSNQRYSYWLQDVMNLNTSNGTSFIGDNIWNMSSSIANVTNATFSGNGNFSIANSTDTSLPAANQSFYGFFLNSTNFTYPFEFVPVIRIDMQNGHPVVRMGYDQNGKFIFYDNVTFNTKAKSAYILITPYYQTPSPAFSPYNGSFYDAEMVIGGEGSGEISQFSKADGTFWIGYLDNNTLVPFPVVGTFGIDTGESSTGLTIKQDGGNAALTTGEPNYNESITLYGVPGDIGNGASSLPTTTFVQNGTAEPATTANATQASSPSAQPGDSTIAVAAVIVALVIGFYLIMRKTARPNSG